MGKVVNIGEKPSYSQLHISNALCWFTDEKLKTLTLFVKKIVALLFATALDEQEAFILRQLQSCASLNKYIWSKFTQPAVN